LAVSSSIAQDSATEKFASKFMEAIENRDSEAAIAMYQDTALYRDLILNTSDRFSLNEIGPVYTETFDLKNGWRIDVVSRSFDMESQTGTLKLDVTNPNGNSGEYIGWPRFLDGKIAEHLDVYNYSAKELLESKKFKNYLVIKPKID